MEEYQDSEKKEIGDAESMNLKEVIKAYNFPLSQKRINNLRNEPQISIISNLFLIEYIDSIHKIYLYSYQILPAITDDNFPLKKVIYQKKEGLIPNEFKKSIFAGNNVYVCIANYKQRNLCHFELSTSIKKEIKLKRAKIINFSDINNNKEAIIF